MSSDKEDEVLPNVKRTILVLSGKGGVGKSTVAAQLALAFQRLGKKVPTVKYFFNCNISAEMSTDAQVGLLDIDLCGPSIPKLFDVETQEVHQCDSGWLPVYTDPTRTLGLMSIGFLLAGGDDGRDEAVVWRGPKKNAMIRQFLTDVAWGPLDVLVVDTPPGTSDEHITVMEALREAKVVGEGTGAAKEEGAVVVTTPQGLSVDDVRRQLSFCRRAGIRVLGILENMSGLRCPHCSECTDIFSSGGGRALAEHAGLPFFGPVPLDPSLAAAADEGSGFREAFQKSPAGSIICDVAGKLL